MSPVHLSKMLLSILEFGLPEGPQPRADQGSLEDDHRGRGKGHRPCHSRGCSRRPEDTPASPAAIGADDRSGQPLEPLLPDHPFQPGPTPPTIALSSASGTATSSPNAGSNATPSATPSSAPGQSTPPAESNSASTQPPSAATESNSGLTQPNSAATQSNSEPTQSISPTEPNSASTQQSPTATMMSMQPSLPAPEPTSSSNPGFPPQSQLARNNLNVGAVAGGVIGGLLFVALIILTVWFFRRRRRLRVAPSAEFMGGTRPSFLPLDSEESLPRDLRDRFGELQPNRMNLDMPKETV